MTSESPRQRETLVLPAFYSTGHLLDRAPEPGETNRAQRRIEVPSTNQKQ